MSKIPPDKEGFFCFVFFFSQKVLIFFLFLNKKYVVALLMSTTTYCFVRKIRRILSLLSGAMFNKTYLGLVKIGLNSGLVIISSGSNSGILLYNIYNFCKVQFLYMAIEKDITSLGR